MDAFRQDLDAQITTHQTTQGSGIPQLIIVATAGVKADHQFRPADPMRQGLEIMGQVITAAFLAGFDDHDTTGMGDTLVRQGADGGE